MAENTKIEWAHHTHNHWMGCAKVSPGCDHCYAEGWAKRSGLVQWGADAPRRLSSEANRRKPLIWNAEAARLGVRYRVFCSSLADVFDNAVPSAWRQNLMTLVADTPHLDWLFLTKRVGNARKMLSDASMHDGRLLTANDEYDPPPNLWIGATIVNQAEAERDIPKLMAVPAARRFLSMEPLLGPVDLSAVQFTVSPGYFGDALQWHHQPYCSRGERYPAVDWVIVGGESGPGARPMHPAWAESLRDQCAAAGVPFLFKQWGEWVDADVTPGGDLGGEMRGGTVRIIKLEGENNGRFERGDALMRRVGKATAGRVLGGALHDGFPA